MKFLHSCNMINEALFAKVLCSELDQTRDRCFTPEIEILKNFWGQTGSNRSGDIELRFLIQGTRWYWCTCQNKIRQLFLGFAKENRSTKTKIAVTSRDPFCTSWNVGTAQDGIINKRGVKITYSRVFENADSTSGIIDFLNGRKGCILDKKYVR